MLTNALEFLRVNICFCHYTRYTLGFVFGHLMQADLDEFVEDWNNHPMRPNRNLDSPCGCPADIYDMPTLHGEYNF